MMLMKIVVMPKIKRERRGNRKAQRRKKSFSREGKKCNSMLKTPLLNFIIKAKKISSTYPLKYHLKQVYIYIYINDLV